MLGNEYDRLAAALWEYLATQHDDPEVRATVHAEVLACLDVNLRENGVEVY